MDLAKPEDTPVLAAAGGIAYVFFDVPDPDFMPKDCPTATSRSFGNHVNIDHGGGFYTVYAHLKTIQSGINGTRVEQGEQIGTIDSTGYSCGHHLHFALHQGDPTQRGTLGVSVPINALLTRRSPDGAIGFHPGSDLVCGPPGIGQRYEAVSLLDDDFNDDSLDPARWSSFKANFANVLERNRRLEITLGPGGPGGGGIISRSSLSGDFDLHLDFVLSSWPPQNPYGVALGAPDLTGSFGPVAVTRNSNVEGFLEFYTLVFGNGATQMPTTDRIGKLRLVRKGGTLCGFFHNGSDWVRVGFGQVSTGSTRIAMDVSTSRSSGPGGILVFLDNVQLNAGTIGCP